MGGGSRRLTNSLTRSRTLSSISENCVCECLERGRRGFGEREREGFAFLDLIWAGNDRSDSNKFVSLLPLLNMKNVEGAMLTFKITTPSFPQ